MDGRTLSIFKNGNLAAGNPSRANAGGTRTTPSHMKSGEPSNGIVGENGMQVAAKAIKPVMRAADSPALHRALRLS